MSSNPKFERWQRELLDRVEGIKKTNPEALTSIQAEGLFGPEPETKKRKKPGPKGERKTPKKQKDFAAYSARELGRSEHMIIVSCVLAREGQSVLIACDNAQRCDLICMRVWELGCSAEVVAGGVMVTYEPGA